MEALHKAADLEPNNPLGFYNLATYYEEKVRKDFRITPAEKKDYIQKGIEATDRAIQLNQDYAEALTYKNILLRHQMRIEPDRNKQQELEREADRLRNRAIDLNKKKSSGAGN
jgi:hypothetical protein